MIYSFSKSLTDSDVRYKFFALSKLQAEPFGQLEGNLKVKLECSDNSHYDTYIDAYRRIKATDFFNSHNWLTMGTMVEFEIDTDTNIVKINIDTESAESEESVIEKELTPALESEVRDFLASKIKKREFENLELYQGIQGVEYNTKEVGVIDILCIDKNKDFIVIEIKKFKESDKVVGQIQRYMGWVKKNLAKDNDKNVRGIIVIQKQEDDYESDKQVKYLRYATAANSNISLKFYKISISLSNDKISSDIE